MRLAYAVVSLSLAAAGALHAQATTRRDTTGKLAPVTTTADSTKIAPLTPLKALTLPVTVGITKQQADTTVNTVDAEDEVKYLPSVLMRKRNNGDNQTVLGTRVWGIGGSARSLIFADGIPLTALIANNNGNGSPQWGLVSPAEIARIDLMQGPFSAAYAGNSIGAVMEITTRMPQTFQGSIAQTQTVMPFDLYGTDQSFGTEETTVDVGNRFGKVAVFASGNYMDNRSQPLAFATSTSFPNGTTGGYAATNKLGTAANVLGATSMLHARMANAKVKVAYDITPTLEAAYTIGYWGNLSDASDESYLEKSGQTTFASQSSFASGFYHLDEQHLANAVSLRSNSTGDWDVDASASYFNYATDNQRLPTAVTAADTFGTAGHVVRMNGTAWRTADAALTWHRGGPMATHTVTLGVHEDQYTLMNTTYNTPDWWTGDSLSGISSEGSGDTRTDALWAQDRWRLASSLLLTVGGRAESMRGYDGININGSTTVHQPDVSFSRFSPKAVLAWAADSDWSVTGSLGKAYRFATASELYQLVTTGATQSSPNPNLRPDDVLATELRVERRLPDGTVGLSYFEQDVRDEIISQYEPLVAGSSTLYSYLSNVNRVRARGLELAFATGNVLLPGLGFSGGATYLDATVLADSGRASASAAPGSDIGKQLPNIPRWRATLVSTYRASNRLSLSLAGRYSGKLYTTLDNTDVNFDTYQAFSDWFVADARALYRVDRNWSASLGVDNLLDRKYFLYHPFPQRTFAANLTYAW